MQAAPESILKKHKLSVTKMRKNVLQLFLDSSAALSKGDIVSRYPEEFDRITLFRTIKKFEEYGIVHIAFDGTENTKYALCQEECAEGNHHHDHIHFHCEQCSSTFCLDEQVDASINLPEGFKTTSQEVIIKGLCRDCSGS